MASPWQDRLDQLHSDLRVLLDSSETVLHHGIVVTKSDPSPVWDMWSPHFYASDACVLEKHRFGLPDGTWQCHFITCNRSGELEIQALKQLKKVLGRSSSLFHSMPKSLLPEFQLPPLPNGSDESFLVWLLMLHWLGNEAWHSVFQIEIEFSESCSDIFDGGIVRPWAEFSPTADFDPATVLTLTHPKDQGYVFWQEEHAKQGRGYPGAICSSLTKPILYASVNAPALLKSKYERLHNRGTKPEVKSSSRVVNQLNERADQLLGILIKHHGCFSEEPNFEPLSVKQMAREMRRIQSIASKALKDLMSRVHGYKNLKPAQRYKLFCQDNLIVGILEHLQMGPPMREKLVGTSDDDFAAAERPIRQTKATEGDDERDW